MAATAEKAIEFLKTLKPSQKVEIHVIAICCKCDKDSVGKCQTCHAELCEDHARAKRNGYGSFHPDFEIQLTCKRGCKKQ
jgi:hypothetical protein